MKKIIITSISILTILAIFITPNLINADEDKVNLLVKRLDSLDDGGPCEDAGYVNGCMYLKDCGRGNSKCKGEVDTDF